jgi:double-stranded uracil-DNA glycosylase
MSIVTSFPPIARHDAAVLILGSMPGRQSLAQGQYYAHPQNAFWPIMGQLLGAGADRSYAERKRLLQKNRIALWDVLHECYRPGSMDTAIRADSEIANDFPALFARCRHIRAVLFNGRKAEATFRRHVRPNISEALGAIATVTLPSTSPAHASLSRAEKLARWRRMLDFL